eukprot:583592-Rhodomonas_salina.1
MPAFNGVSRENGRYESMPEAATDALHGPAMVGAVVFTHNGGGNGSNGAARQVWAAEAAMLPAPAPPLKIRNEPEPGPAASNKNDAMLRKIAGKHHAKGQEAARRRKKIIMAAVCLLLVLAGVGVGVYLALSGGDEIIVVNEVLPSALAQDDMKPRVMLLLRARGMATPEEFYPYEAHLQHSLAEVLAPQNVSAGDVIVMETRVAGAQQNRRLQQAVEPSLSILTSIVVRNINDAVRVQQVLPGIISEKKLDEAMKRRGVNVQFSVLGAISIFIPAICGDGSRSVEQGRIQPALLSRLSTQH